MKYAERVRIVLRSSSDLSQELIPFWKIRLKCSYRYELKIMQSALKVHSIFRLEKIGRKGFINLSDWNKIRRVSSILRFLFRLAMWCSTQHQVVDPIFFTAWGLITLQLTTVVKDGVINVVMMIMILPLASFHPRVFSIMGLTARLTAVQLLLFQKNIKKIMSIESIGYAEATHFKGNRFSLKAFLSRKLPVPHSIILCQRQTKKWKFTALKAPEPLLENSWKLKIIHSSKFS